jgi:hypothetical protein
MTETGGHALMRKVGRYVILRELGSGGMATVYLAKQVDLDRLVALKELSVLRLKDPAFARRFLRESRVAGSLAHPNIVTVHDYFEVDGTPYIAMEYVSNGSLRPRIGQLTPAQIGGVLAGVLAGLAHAERRGVVHRDLKPENLMVTDDGRVKITDFGIAKATSSVRTMAELTATGTTLGTPNYMAPEQAMGKEIGPWSDLYSLGIVAFEMLVGRVPFYDTQEPMAVLMRQAREPIPSVRSLCPDVDPAISDWVARLLVKDPARRTRSATAAWRELEEALIGALGPRWDRGAGLAEGVDYAAPAFETPATSRLRARTPPTVPRASSAKTMAPRRAAPTQPAPRRAAMRRRRGALNLVAPLLLLLLAGGVIAHRRSGSRLPSSKPTAVSTTRELSLAVPPGWKTAERMPETRLPLSDAVALAPGGRSDRPSVVYGVMRADSAANSALLPAPFLASLGQPAGQLPPRTRTTLRANALPAWRYRDLRPLGSSRALTIYVVPTTAGVATVACLASPGAAAAPAKTCDAIASTLRLRSATPYPIGPSRGYAAAVTHTLNGLQHAVGAHGGALEQAQTDRARSQAAAALARDYRRSARTLEALTLSPSDRTANARLVSVLRQVGDAYVAVAHAAATSDAAFGRARATAAGREKDIDGAIAAVRAVVQDSGTSDTTTNQPQPTCSAGEQGEGQSDDPSDDAGDCGEP